MHRLISFQKKHFGGGKTTLVHRQLCAAIYSKRTHTWNINGCLNSYLFVHSFYLVRIMQSMLSLGMWVTCSHNQEITGHTHALTGLNIYRTRWLDPRFLLRKRLMTWKSSMYWWYQFTFCTWTRYTLGWLHNKRCTYYGAMCVTKNHFCMFADGTFSFFG